LIAAVVGLHFIPFAWAFNERMFFWLGGLVCGLGTIGLLAGALASRTQPRRWLCCRGSSC